ARILLHEHLQNSQRSFLKRTRPDGFLSYHERLFQNILKYHLGEPVSGLLLFYPSSILHILESSSGTLYHILQDLASLQNALLQEIKILVVSHNIPTRLFLQWYVTRVTLPVTYLEDVTQSQSTEEVVTECLTLLLKLGTYLSKTFKVKLVSSKGLGDNLHTLVPELLIPAETISYLCKAKQFMSPEEFLKMYSNPLQPAMASGLEHPAPSFRGSIGTGISCC
uniref:Testis expressed 47 n=1 Tax=Pelusios castaneus TaxID=367368 RepID=A0A8C8S226_9SAUR